MVVGYGIKIFWPGLFITSPDHLEALVYPLLNKSGMDILFKNFRPVSSLLFISKLAEKAVINHTYTFTVEHGLYPLVQSSYRTNHSTESALLKVKNDILLRLNEQHVVTLLILLDPSAAFDTVNHTILSSFFVSWISVIQRLSGSSRAHRVVVSVYPSVVACLRGLISAAGFLKALVLDHSCLPYTRIRRLMLFKAMQCFAYIQRSLI